MKTPRSLLLATLLFSTSIAIPAAQVINASFEKSIPRELNLNNLDGAIDTSRAHSGKASLRATPRPGSDYNTIFIDLDGRMNFNDGCEFSIWIYAEPQAKPTAYISASDGDSRYTLVDATGTITPGQWCQLTGTVYPGEIRKDDREFKLILRTRGTCWIDDFTLTSTRADTPSQIWPRLERSLQTAANKRVSPLKPGDSLVLDARNAALAPDTARAETAQLSDPAVVIPAEGMLVFSIDAKDDLELTGSLQLEPDADLRPGLRVTVLSDNTVIAAPGVKAAPWRGTSTGSDRPGPAPDIRGECPPVSIPLTGWRMAKGRHYITIAGPHIRPGGTFARLELNARERPAEKPLYSFGFFSDTHLGFGRGSWSNTKLNARTGGELEAALRQLKREGADFAVIAGDMTDGGRRSQFEELARVVKRADLPVYGCVGNHDTFRDSRKDIATTLPKLFPDGPDNTDYAFSRPPLRFIVLDGSYWRGQDAPIQGFRAGRANQTTYSENIRDWLRDTLAKDTTTPTIVVSHYQFYLRRGVSPVTGYDLGKDPTMDKMLMTTLATAPNVVATLNGHYHYNMVSAHRGITSLQNPAFAEWPNAYRVCRVYPDRMEWEVRQMPNRGLIRESVRPEMALLWSLSLRDDDLATTVSLAPRPPRAPVEVVVNDGFEGDRIPANGFSPYRVDTAIDTTRAHSGSASLRITPSADWGSVAYELDPIMDFGAGAEASVWIYAEPGVRVSSYISAQAGDSKDRHTVANATGAVTPGKWSRLTVKVPADKWRMDERDVRFIVRAYGPCWIDDASLKAVRE